MNDFGLPVSDRSTKILYAYPVVEYAEGLIALGKYKKHGQFELGQKET